MILKLKIKYASIELMIKGIILIFNLTDFYFLLTGIFPYKIYSKARITA